MAEWFVEEGIAEQRALRLSGDRIVEARIWWPGEFAAGWVVEGKVAHRTSGSSRGTAVTQDGTEILLSGLAKDAREGAAVRIGITRAAILGAGRLKRAQGRLTQGEPRMPDLAGQLRADGHSVTITRRFPRGDWDDLLGEALSGTIAFPGGELLFASTPAMLTIDIDGDLPPRSLALAAIPPLAEALRRFDIGGSIVVDFPTLSAKEDRRAVDAALETALADWPHERTAINGFGLVQIVWRLERSSLLHRAAWQRPALLWRDLLRRAEKLGGPGVLELTVAPAIAAVARSEDIAALERRCATTVKVIAVGSQGLDTPHVQMIAHG